MSQAKGFVLDLSCRAGLSMVRDHMTARSKKKTANRKTAKKKTVARRPPARRKAAKKSNSKSKPVNKVAEKSDAAANLVSGVAQLASGINSGAISGAIIISISSESPSSDSVSFAGTVPADRAAYLLRLADAWNITRVLKLSEGK
jgi:uncharacterized protein (UPF0261 family)